MKKAVGKKVTAAIAIAAMAMSTAACGSDAGSSTATTETPAATDAQETTETAEAPAAEETAEAEPEEEEGEYAVIKDADGNPIDLGGITVYEMDYWSGDGYEPGEPSNEFQEAQQEYQEWVQETYNFTFKKMGAGDWATAGPAYVDYVTSGGDDEYRYYILHDSLPEFSSAVNSGLMYDIATLDCIDLTLPRYTNNTAAAKYTVGDKTYAMQMGFTEPRDGFYFNRRILTDAGVDPDSLYDLQASGDWTWEKAEEIFAKVQQDTDNDGTIDIYAFGSNTAGFVTDMVFANDGSYFKRDASGKIVNNVEAPETIEGLNKAVEWLTNYGLVAPEGAEWNYYQQAFINGETAFMVDAMYAMRREEGNQGFLAPMTDECGFVAMPKGPKMNDYMTVATNNYVVIPSCYDADKAWKCAFAYDIYNQNPPGYDDSDTEYSSYVTSAMNSVCDIRTATETIPMMMTHGVNYYYNLVPGVDLGQDLTWHVNFANADVTAAVEAIKDTWDAYAEDANK